MTGILPEAEEEAAGAFLPVNTDDDDYDADNKADFLQEGEGGIVGETDLLPVILRQYKGPAGAGYFWLDIPSNLRVWQNGTDRTGQVDVTTNIPDAANTRLYVEAIDTSPNGAEFIKINWTDGTNTVTDGDRIKITAFFWSGPINVPGYSIHQYHVDDAALPAGGGWQPGLDGDIKEGANTSTMKILSGPGPKVEKRVYEVNDEYTWDLEVNVVEVKIDAPAAGAAFTFTPGTPADDGNPVLNNIARKSVRAGDLPAGLNPPQNPGLKWGARVTLNGPKGGRGLKFMVVGFIQNVIGYEHQGVYASGAMLTGDKTDTMTPALPVLDAAIGAAEPWYIVGFPGFASKVDNWNVANNVREIWDWDTPRNGPPLTADQGPQVIPGVDDLLSSITYINTFSLNVCVQTKDDRQNANKVYTRRATVEWTFNGSGTVGNNNPWPWQPIAGTTGDTVAAPANWTPVTDGTEPKTDGDVALQEVAAETFS